MSPCMICVWGLFGKTRKFEESLRWKIRLSHEKRIRKARSLRFEKNIHDIEEKIRKEVDLRRNEDIHGCHWEKIRK